MPHIRSSVSKCRLRLVLLIFSFNKIMPSCSRYIEKQLFYMAILVPSSRQLSFYVECTRINI